MERAIILDIETCGNEPQEVVQLAWVGDDVRSVFNRRYVPTKPITPEAFAVHMIRVDHNDNPSEDAASDVPKHEYVIGHGIDFDAEVLGLKSKRICTLAMARHLMPEVKSHKLTVCFVVTEEANEGERSGFLVSCLASAHDALFDVLMTQKVYRELCKRAKLDPCDYAAVYEFSEQCRIPKVWPFGKHVGKPISETPRDYLEWFVKQSDVDPYLRTAIERAMR